MLDPALGADVPLGHAKKTHILTASNGLKVGLIGLAEREWLVTVNSLPPDLVYQSASETAKKLAPELRRQGADIVIAITHAREPNDNKLARSVPAGLIDIILGGHDHFYGHSLINGCHVLRSGTDFRNLSYITAWRKQGGGWDIDIARQDIVRAIPRDSKAAELVEKISSGLRSKLERPIGYTAAPLDARFMTVRLKESNIGNFICDLMRLYYSADCTIMAAGTIRGDQVYPPGVLKSKDLMNWYRCCSAHSMGIWLTRLSFPFEDPVVVLRVKGQAILGALENGVSLYPALEGRFPQVSNIRFSFNPQQPAGQRVHNVTVGGEPVDLSRRYLLATRDYMARGKDGFDSLLYEALGGEAEEIVSDENGILISMLLRQYFMSLRTLGLWGMPQAVAEDEKSSTKEARHDVATHFQLKVHDTLHECHPIKSPAASRANSPLPGAPHVAQQKPTDVIATVERQHEDDSDDEEEPLGEDEHRGQMHTSADHHDHHSRRFKIMRQVLRKWARIAGLADRLSLPNEQNEGEFQVGTDGSVPTGMEWMRWTRAIAPRVEGRIVCVG